MLKITPAPANSAARAGYVCLLALFSTLAARAELPYPELVIDLTAGLVIAWHGRYGKTMLWLSLPLPPLLMLALGVNIEQILMLLALRWLVVASFFSADSAHRLSEFLSHPALPALWRLVLWSAFIAFASALFDFLVRTYALNQGVDPMRIPCVAVSAALSLLGALTAYGAWLRRDSNNPLDRFSPLRAGALLLGLIATYGLSWLVPETASMVPVALLMLMASFAVSPRVAYALCAVAVIALSYCLALALQHPALLEVAQHHGLPYVQSVIFSVLLGGQFLAAQSAERQRLIANLQRRDSDLRLTTNMLAHDLKSPLVTLNGFVGLLKLKLSRSAPDLVAGLEPLSRGVQRLTHVTMRLANYLALGEEKPVDAVISPQQLLARCADELSAELDAQMVTLELRCTAPSMTTDPLRAHCIVVNLLGNAVRHAALVGQRATVVGQIEVANGWIELTVEDSGSGVRTLDRAKIFEPTTRLHHTPGSGLGLHLVKTALADLKGVIDVQVSTSLGGARFKARWPEGGVG